VVHDRDSRESAAGGDAVISVDTALTTARETLATVTERAEQNGYYSGARTAIINSHSELRSALDMLIKAADAASEAPPSRPAN
jgi:hypothetical protein